MPVKLEELNKLVSCIQETRCPVIVGIDEAGRGPVIGPMVYGMCVMHPDEVVPYKDSKDLTPKKREEYFKGMKNYAYYEIDPVFITSHMEKGTMSLNDISRHAVIILLKNLTEKCKNVVKVYVDGLGNNVEYKNALRSRFDLDFVVENKADSKYQVVGGASIVAKVIRDSRVEKLGCGSGYPSDPITQEWLKNNNNGTGEFPRFVRHSWKTIKDLEPKKKSRRLEGNLNGFYTGPD